MKGVSRRTIHLYPGELGDLVRAARSSVDEGRAQVAAFEDAFTRHLDVRFAIAVGSGRLGLRLILKHKGIGRGHRVIVPTYTDQSVPQAIRQLGAEPIYVDVEAHTHNLDPDALEALLDERPQALIATHLFGAPCNMDRVQHFCAENDIILIEDCAHAVDAKSQGRNCGTIGDAAIFSFVVTKAINTFGGGMVVTNDEALAYAIRQQVSELPQPEMDGLLRRIITGYAINAATQPSLFGAFGLRMLRSSNGDSGDAIAIYNQYLRAGTVNASRDTGFSPLQAAVGIQQLRRLTQTQARRQSIAARIAAVLPDQLVLQSLRAGDKHAWYFVVATADDPDAVVRSLFADGVDVGRYPMRNCAVLDEPRRVSEFPGAEYLYHHSLQLPAYPSMCDEALKQLLDALSRLDRELT